MELIAYKAYKNPELELAYWRTSTGLEVDFIINKMEVAIEIKASRRVHETDAQALKLLQQENTVKKSIIVSFEPEKKIILNNIICLHWSQFLNQMWSGNLF